MAEGFIVNLIVCKHLRCITTIFVSFYDVFYNIKVFSSNAESGYKQKVKVLPVVTTRGTEILRTTVAT